MIFEFPGIILDDKLYSIEDIVEYGKKKVKENIPEWEANIYKFIIEFLDGRDYIMQSSSGTTGARKEYKLSKQALIESAKRTSKILGLGFGKKALLCLPVEYIAGKMMIVRAFVAGLNLCWEEPSSMPSIAKHGKLNFCAMVPLQVYNSFSNYEFVKNIENLIIGGSELRPEVVAMFRGIENNTFETYGMAETCSHVALRKISGANPDEYFIAVPGVEFSVDKRSCLIIKAEYLPETIHTNDVVELIDSKRFLWQGRFDNLINSGGVKVKPEEIEADIAKVLDIDFAVVGLPDKELGQLIALVAESEVKLSNDEILDSLKEVLAKHHLPKKVITIPQLPRNKAYKIDRRKLSSMLENK